MNEVFTKRFRLTAGLSVERARGGDELRRPRCPTVAGDEVAVGQDRDDEPDDSDSEQNPTGSISVNELGHYVPNG